jgi:hypothetical protein
MQGLPYDGVLEVVNHAKHRLGTAGSSGSRSGIVGPGATAASKQTPKEPTAAATTTTEQAAKEGSSARRLSERESE